MNKTHTPKKNMEHYKFIDVTIFVVIFLKWCDNNINSSSRQSSSNSNSNSDSNDRKKMK